MDNRLVCLQPDFLDTDFISQTYKNAMELLVNEEIDKQMSSLPSDVKAEINFVEVAAYALNRLPSLYASSEEGFYRQKQRGQTEFQAQIVRVVKEALATIERDPLRFSTPLSTSDNRELQEAKVALAELVDWLWFGRSDAQKEKISYKEAIEMIRETLMEEAKIEIARDEVEEENC